MLLRMGLIALVVLALAGPYSTSAVFAPLSERPPRDVVIVLDGSFSMDRRDERGQTPWAEACRWAAEHVAQMARGGRAAPHRRASAAVAMAGNADGRPRRAQCEACGVAAAAWQHRATASCSPRRGARCGAQSEAAERTLSR